MTTITERLKAIIANDLDVNVKLDGIADDAGLLEDGIGLDSVALMEFISIIEERFSIEFSDDELGMEPFRNLETLSACIAQKQETT